MGADKFNALKLFNGFTFRLSCGLTFAGFTEENLLVSLVAPLAFFQGRNFSTLETFHLAPKGFGGGCLICHGTIRSCGIRRLRKPDERRLVSRPKGKSLLLTLQLLKKLEVPRLSLVYPILNLSHLGNPLGDFWVLGIRAQSIVQ